MEAETQRDVGFEPAPGPANIEAVVGFATARRAVWVGPPLIALFGLHHLVLEARVLASLRQLYE